MATTAAASGALVAPTPLSLAIDASTMSPRPRPQAFGWLQVSVMPWADVTVDGRARGPSPQYLRLPVGTHTLVVTGGIPRREERVRITENQVTTFTAHRDD
jgi:hypothetical protein